MEQWIQRGTDYKTAREASVTGSITNIHNNQEHAEHVWGERSEMCTVVRWWRFLIKAHCRQPGQVDTSIVATVLGSQCLQVYRFS